MIFLWVVLGLCVAPLCAQQPRIVSPEIAADRMVTFRLNAPKATEVILTGEFIKGSQPLANQWRV